MNTALHENRMTRYVQIFHGQKTFEVSGETVVPDKMPDMGLLGETTPLVLLRSKETAVGMGSMDGELDVSACYIPDGSAGFCRLELHLPWQVQFEGEEISDRAVAMGEVAVQRIETRMLNPRKILVKAQLTANFTCFIRQEIAVCDHVAGESAVQVRRETLSCSMISTVCERSFVATDEYPVPPDLVGGEILCKSVQFQVEDVKTLANKLIVKGSTQSDVVIASATGAAERVSFTSGFSFIAETDCDTVSPDVKVSVMPTAMYYELSDQGQVLSVEVHGVCQMAAYTKEELCYISDAYSNFYDCSAEYRPIAVYQNLKTSSQRETVTETIPCRSQIACVLFSTAQLDAATGSGERVQVPLRLGVCVQYENGSVDWLKKSVSVPVQLKPEECLAVVRVSDVHGVAAGSQVDCRVILEYELQSSSELTVDTISAITTDEECPCTGKRPSLIVLQGGGSLWELARRYGSTMELIRTYNGLEEDATVCEGMLLIPKQQK